MEQRRRRWLTARDFAAGAGERVKAVTVSGRPRSLGYAARSSTTRLRPTARKARITVVMWEP